MRNAKRLDARVTVGRVPDSDDLLQLKELGYRTLADVREDSEKFGGHVERRARELGLDYVSVPISRAGIGLEDVMEFYRVVYRRGVAPIYAFSRFGKKPLAFLLLFEAAVGGEPLARIFERASRIGIDLRGDLTLQEFLVGVYNSGELGRIVEPIAELRPDLFHDRPRPREGLLGQRPGASRHAPRERRERALGQRGCTVWLTGLPASGKSTTAFTLERELLARGRLAYVLDSDNVRPGLSKDLGFSAADREENARRIAELAKLFADSGLVVVASSISPYAKDRALARELHAAAGLGFVEVFVDARLETCEARDSRGLYARARGGEIAGFTGVDSPYEPPRSPDLVVDTEALSPTQAASRIVDHLARAGFLGPPPAGSS